VDNAGALDTGRSDAADRRTSLAEFALSWMDKSDNAMWIHPSVMGEAALPGESFNGRASMKDVIAFILGNFTLTFFVLGLLASAIALCRARPPRAFALIVEALFSYFVLFSIGFSSLYNFVFHVFFGKLAAGFIGWEDSLPSSWRSVSPALALRWWDCWRSGEASICGSRPSSGRPASSGARPAFTSIR